MICEEWSMKDKILIVVSDGHGTGPAAKYRSSLFRVSLLALAGRRTQAGDHVRIDLLTSFVKVLFQAIQL